MAAEIGDGGAESGDSVFGGRWRQWRWRHPLRQRRPEDFVPYGVGQASTESGEKGDASEEEGDEETDAANEPDKEEEPQQEKAAEAPVPPAVEHVAAQHQSGSAPAVRNQQVVATENQRQEEEQERVGVEQHEGEITRAAARLQTSCG